MNDPRSIAVIGVTGYTGFELATLLLRHPGISKPTFYVRETGGAHCLSQMFPQLRGWGEAPVKPLSLEAMAKSQAGTAFLATPHQVSSDLAPQLLDEGLRVIDLSAAFRFASPDSYSTWYKLPAPHASRFGAAVYGLPELYADPIRGAKLVANPGCYATSVILALRPLQQAGLLASGHTIVCDCKSGASGAGKDPRRDLHFVELEGNFRAYNLFAHRHTPEILDHTGLKESQIIFSTHLLPIPRGILSSIYVTLATAHTAQDIEALYRQAYAGHPLVRIHPAGTLPEIQHIVKTNFCDIGFALHADGKRLVVLSCLDNLGKGAAGQAVQNLNLMLGLEERTGLI
jgi:N-acetyl-gamma-glutamyl-phosphate reductase